MAGRSSGQRVPVWSLVCPPNHRRQKVQASRCAFNFRLLVFRRNSVVTIDLAISKETDIFQPLKQTRLYGVTMALSQCPQGNPRGLFLFRGWEGPGLQAHSPGRYLSGPSQP